MTFFDSGLHYYTTNKQTNMASQILELDSAYRPSSEPPSWHKQEDEVPGEITKKEQIPNVAIKIHAEPFPVPPGYKLGSNKIAKMIVADHPKGKVIIDTFSLQYRVFSNDEIVDKVWEAFAANNIPAKLAFALTMHNLAMVSYSFEIPGSEFFAGARPHKMYAGFSSSHNGKQGLRGFGTVTNTVCANTHLMAMKGEKHGFDFTWWHDAASKKQFDNLPKLIEATQHHAQLYSKLAAQMANKTINQKQAHAIALQLLAKDQKEVSAQAVNASEEIAVLFKTGIGNSGSNLFDFFNAVTQHYTRGNGSGGEKVSPYKKMISSEFGAASEKKVFVLRSLQRDNGDLLSDAELNSLVLAGDKLLHEYA